MSEIIPFPFDKTAEMSTNDVMMEFAFLITAGHPPARQKLIIMQMRAIGLLGDMQTEIALDALGLKGA